MISLKISLFHLLCCLLGMCVIAFNLTVSQHINMEVVLYTIYSILMIISYFVFGNKFIQINNNTLKVHTQIWLLSVILVIIAFADIRMVSLLNLSFQPLSALFHNKALNERIIYIVTSLLPSALIHIGYIYNTRGRFY